MSNKIRAAITGVHGYVPPYVVTNDELSLMVDTNDEWITSRTGIKERRFLKGNHGASYMAAEAVKGLLEKTNTNPEDVDLLIVGTITADYTFPSAANIVSSQLGLKNAWSYDVNAACSGFIYSLVTGAQFIETGKYKKVVVVGVDKMNSIINYADRSTCVIFGDGGGAVLLEPSTSGNGIIDFEMKSDGEGCKFLYKNAGGSLNPSNQRNILDVDHFVHQEGQAVFKFAVYNMAEISYNVMTRNGLTGDDIQWLAAHQANKRIIEATANRLSLPPEKVMLNIHRYGNTTAGTIPLLLWDYENQLKDGDNIIVSAFGGGFTWGSIYLKWGK